MSHQHHTIPSSECTLDTCDLSQANLDYVPTLAGNSIYFAIFAALLVFQIGAGIKYRTWGFMVAMMGGLILECLGYIGRLMLHSNPFNFNSFILYIVCLTIGPAFLSACIYLSLGKIISVQGPHLSRLSPRMYTYLFVGFDFISLVLQSLGGALASNHTDADISHLGIHIMIAGVSSQVVSMAAFMLVWIELWLRTRHASETDKPAEFATLRNSSTFKRFEIALAIATVLIFVRCVYRVVELAGGFDGAVANNEPAFMVFEAPFVAGAAAALSFFHPGRVFKGDWTTAASAGKEDRMRGKYSAEGYSMDTLDA
ncbi:hypothetical protein HDU87_001811 [Geranomyces variabilis]|uniref:Uncharacterized protein n=1 Tax=Geranomyces variabilis TaxID=109894 RepID=A0AAD5TPE0_9FUNG|nr:hypothetical protein HDU87_001811 [Geranomyces variabilis]